MIILVRANGSSLKTATIEIYSFSDTRVSDTKFYIMLASSELCHSVFVTLDRAGGVGSWVVCFIM